MKLLKVSPSPHLRATVSTSRIMCEVLIALFPALLWAIYVFGWRSLWLTLASVAGAELSELVFCLLTKRKISIGDMSSVVTGVLLAFSLPVSAPLWIPVVGSFFAVVIVKMLFGGVGKNFVNPALSARAFLFISFPAIMTEFTRAFDRFNSAAIEVSVTPDAVSSSTILADIKSVTDNVSGNYLLDMFLGKTAGCIGEVSALLLLAGGVYLFARKIISYHIPVAFILSVFLISFVFPRGQAEPVFCALTEVLSGGLMLGAIFMATDYVTSPISSVSKLIFGVGCGLITVAVRMFGNYPEGVSFAILIMNTLVYFLDKVAMPKPFGYYEKLRRDKEKANEQ